MKILFLMADGFEETEFVTPFDYFQRAGIEVSLASITEQKIVEGGHGLKIAVENTLSDLTTSFDGVFLPGGGVGVQNLSASTAVLDIVKKFNDENKWVVAICAAPLVLSKAGVLVHKKATCYPGCETDLNCLEFSEDRVVIDGKIITSRGAGTAEEFSFACIQEFLGQATAEKIRNQVVAR